MALQTVAVGAACGCPSQLTITVDGFAPPWPQVQLSVMVIKNQHDKATRHTVLTLLKQGLATNEICVLGRKIQERGEMWKDIQETG